MMTDQRLPNLLPDEDVDQFEWWRTACEHPEWIGTDKLPIHEGHPEMGYFRVRTKGGQWEPVAFFRDPESGILNAERNKRPVLAEKIGDLWLWACRFPVRWEDWEQATLGNGWADEPELPATIGDNIREADPVDALNIEWLGEQETIEEFLRTPITTQDAADKCGIWKRRLNSIVSRADTFHSSEKAPVLVEARRIDDRWRDLREAPALLIKRMTSHLKVWMDEQDRRERERVAAAKREEERLREEARRKVAEAEAAQRRAQEEAMRQQREAERLAAEGRQAEARAAEAAAEMKLREGDRALSEAGKAVADVKEAERQTIYRNPQAGRTGQKVAMTTYTSAQVDDWSLLIDALKDRDEVRTVAQKLADKAAKAGIALAGCTILKERRPA